LALLNHAYPDDRERGRAVGIWAAGASLALTAGPLAGGGLIALAGWRGIFLVNLPIGLAGLWLTWRYASGTRSSPSRRLDIRGQVAAIGALGCLAATMIGSGALGWRDPFILLGFAGFLALSASFIFHENRDRQPMLPLSLFRRRLFTVTAIVGLLVNVAFYGLIFVLSLYFQQVVGLSPFMTGLEFVPMIGVVLPANLLAPRAAERFGAPTVIACGATVAAAGCIGLIGIGPDTNYSTICAQLVALGAGLGLLVPPLTSTLLGSVEKARSGLAAGVLNATRQTGSVLGVALFGSLVGLTNEFVHGAREALIISAVLLLCAAAAIAGARREKLSELNNESHDFPLSSERESRLGRGGQA
jgi:DHA2 family methylenomycin A resistance protein-like MFS transporter